MNKASKRQTSKEMEKFDMDIIVHKSHFNCIFTQWHMNYRYLEDFFFIFQLWILNERMNE